MNGPEIGLNTPGAEALEGGLESRLSCLTCVGNPEIAQRLNTTLNKLPVFVRHLSFGIEILGYYPVADTWRDQFIQGCNIPYGGLPGLR